MKMIEKKRKEKNVERKSDVRKNGQKDYKRRRKKKGSGGLLMKQHLMRNMEIN